MLETFFGVSAVQSFTIKTEAVTFSIEGGIFFVFYPHGADSFGWFFNQQEFNLRDLEKKIKDFRAGYKVKVIGPATQEKLVADLVKKCGGFLEKYVVKSVGKVWFEASSGRVRIEKAEEFDQKRKIRAVIVDDSKTIRQLLRSVLSEDKEIEIIADFENPAQALIEIPKLRPDVITLDIHMPNLDGVQFLKQLMPKTPIPTVMISSISIEEGPMVLNALEAGAVDYVQKPSFEELDRVSPLIVEKVKMAAKARLVKKSNPSTEKNTTSSIYVGSGHFDLNRIIAIGSSTGGTEALREILTRLPKEIPPILIVQHIPAVFSRAFADRVNSLCEFRVKEAEDGDLVQPNTVYIAPGGFQMSVVAYAGSGASYRIKIADTEPVNRHKPSVDVLFNSVAKVVGKKAVGVILTGMGADGAKGLLELKNIGCQTFGQDEQSCVVYGMPQAAKKIGAVGKELPLLSIPEAVLEAVTKKTKAA